MEVKYNHYIQDGQIIPLAKVQKQPTILFTFPFENNSFYTLIMHDPDAVGGNKIHWLIVNMHLNQKHHINGDTLLKYKGPAPPIHTGNHRYIFLLYKQPFLYNNIHPWKTRFYSMLQIHSLLHLKGIKPIAQLHFLSSHSNSNKGTTRKKRDK